MDAPAIATLEPADRDRAIAVVVAAFSADPVMRWLYPEARDYLAHFPSFVAAFGGGAIEHGTAHVAEPFGGVALWLPVGVQVDPERVEAVITQTLAPERLESSGPMLEQMERFHTEDPHWYLPMIGVDPARQGRGLGSALLRHALARCDEEGVAAYLESSNPANIPLYQRHGFEVIGEIQAGDSPVLYPMLRAAQRPGG